MANIKELSSVGTIPEIGSNASRRTQTGGNMNYSGTQKITAATNAASKDREAREFIAKYGGLPVEHLEVLAQRTGAIANPTVLSFIDNAKTGKSADYAKETAIQASLISPTEPGGAKQMSSIQTDILTSGMGSDELVDNVFKKSKSNRLNQLIADRFTQMQGGSSEKEQTGADLMKSIAMIDPTASAEEIEGTAAYNALGEPIDELGWAKLKQQEKDRITREKLAGMKYDFGRERLEVMRKNSSIRGANLALSVEKAKDSTAIAYYKMYTSLMKSSKEAEENGDTYTAALLMDEANKTLGNIENRLSDIGYKGTPTKFDANPTGYDDASGDETSVITPPPSDKPAPKPEPKPAPASGGDWQSVKTFKMPNGKTYRSNQADQIADAIAKQTGKSKEEALNYVRKQMISGKVN